MANCRLKAALAASLVFLALAPGCARGPAFLELEKQPAIDRALVEYPAGFEFKTFATGFTAPTAMAFDADGTLFVVEGGGVDGGEPRIMGRKRDGTIFNVYPVGRRIPFS
ncbi:MAG: hypothetical protein ACREIT_12415, partial [Tepidisphaeraceae bacterium]